MTIRQLLRMGDSNLLKRAEKVEDIHEKDVQLMIGDMLENMHHYGGIGIAAPQIGYFMRIIIFGFEKNERYPGMAPIPSTILINPEVEILTDQTVDGWEGCLSVPGYRGLVPRYTHIRYQGYDRQGKLISREVADFHARVVQHEYDHINGVLFPMRIQDMRNFVHEDVYQDLL